MNELAPAVGYVGEFARTLDARNRLTVPAEWRAPGDEGIYYMAWPHPDGCIAVFPPEMQKTLAEKARNIRQFDRQGQALLRAVFAKASKFGCDKQGRILLPENLLQHAGIEKGAWLVGTGLSFQIWSDAKYSPAQDFDMFKAMEALDF